MNLALLLKYGAVALGAYLVVRALSNPQASVPFMHRGDEQAKFLENYTRELRHAAINHGALWTNVDVVGNATQSFGGQTGWKTTPLIPFV